MQHNILKLLCEAYIVCLVQIFNCVSKFSHGLFLFCFPYTQKMIISDFCVEFYFTVFQAFCNNSLKKKKKVTFMKFFSECGRTIPGVAKGSKMMRFYVDNIPDKFVGLCLFFVRLKNDSHIKAKSIHEVISHTILKTTNLKSRSFCFIICFNIVILPNLLVTP